MRRVWTAWVGIFLLIFCFIFSLNLGKAQAAPLVDIIWIVDESSSMQNDQQNIKNNLDIFTQTFANANFDIQYALVGFGWASTTNPDPFIRLVTGLTDANGFKAGLDQLHEIGSLEKGFQATKFAIDNVTRRSGSIPIYIVVTDEDADGVHADADAALFFINALWNGIVNLNDYVGPGGDYSVLANNHGGQLFSIDAFAADPQAFFTFFANEKLKEVQDHNGGGNGDPVIPEPSSLFLLGVGVVAALGLRRKVLS